MPPKRNAYYADRVHLKYPEGFGKIENGRMNVFINKRKKPVILK
jgi:hypothetical protein